MISTETIVRGRYAGGAKERVEKLCCPVDYDAQYWEPIPRGVIERNYGCGDPSRYLQAGGSLPALRTAKRLQVFVENACALPCPFRIQRLIESGREMDRE